MSVKPTYLRSYNGALLWTGCRGKLRCVVCWSIGNTVPIVVFPAFRNVNTTTLGRAVGPVRPEECEAPQRCGQTLAHRPSLLCIFLGLGLACHFSAAEAEYGPKRPVDTPGIPAPAAHQLLTSRGVISRGSLGLLRGACVSGETVLWLWSLWAETRLPACLSLRRPGSAPGSHHSWPLQCFVSGLRSRHLPLPLAV